MKRLDLIQKDHDVKIGQECPTFEPNVTEDCIFYLDGKPVGFFMREIPEKLRKLANLADALLRSKDVPKRNMRRLSVDGVDEKTGKNKYKNAVVQYSTILGSIPPKPHMRREYATISSVHSVKSARKFVKAMLLLAKKSEKVIKEILPEQYELQKKLLSEVPEKWRFANLFTSSISNYNISASYHRDTGNIVGASNVIITKRKNAKGGNLNVPDYGLTMDSVDNSMLVYPAWKNVHGVTPIEPTYKDGYRNSLIFYPLKAFKGLK